MFILWVIFFIRAYRPHIVLTKLTYWGAFITFLASLSSNLIYPDSKQFFKDRHHPCKAFKCYVILWYTAITLELIVTAFYWIIIWKKEYIREGDYLNLSGKIIDHTLPIFVLLIDYVFLSAIPISKRHIWVVMTISVVYLGMNCIYSLSIEPVYGPPLDWVTPIGIILPLGALVIGFIFDFALEAVNRNKLRLLGYTEFVDMLQSEFKNDLGQKGK